MGSITKLPITEAKARLTDLVRRAEEGADLVSTKYGPAVARLVAIHHKPSARSRAKLIAAIRARAIAKATLGPGAARCWPARLCRDNASRALAAGDPHSGRRQPEPPLQGATHLLSGRAPGRSVRQQAPRRQSRDRKAADRAPARRLGLGLRQSLDGLRRKRQAAFGKACFQSVHGGQG